MTTSTVTSPSATGAVTAAADPAERPVSPATAHLDAADVAALAAELDALRDEVLAGRGARDAAYIRRVIAVQRGLELGGRALLVVGSRRRPVWVLGAACLATAKVLDNMEIGHNVLHGQWDWMRDPKIHSATWDWDHVTPPEQWKRSHNELHHVHTNVLGHDNDLGYGILRVDEAQPWRPRHAVQPLWNLVNAVFFEYGIALYDLEVGETLRAGRRPDAEMRGRIGDVLRRARRQLLKDLVIHPALSGPGWRSTLSATLAANLVRNLWSHSVIMCGHFPEGVETFELDETPTRETRGEWYLRQMLGSADITGPPLLHVLAGNLSHQIEHHVFPDLPSNRYAEIAPRLREVMERHGLTYHAAPLHRQVASAWHKVVRLSVPPRVSGSRRGR
ncbi:MULTISPECIES: acyl-CoA desaturase [Nocardioides]|uniref:fatty acid desaturase family protein n=1 Tax=Nocardioides TaxID=1839 RepID=UPI0027DF61C4|nr:acyl-CoA desaturase [Nocardioides sp. P86]